MPFHSLVWKRDLCFGNWVWKQGWNMPPEVQHRQGWAFPQTFCKEDCYLPSFLHKLSKAEVAMKWHDMGGIVTTGSLTDESRLLGKLTLRHIVGLTRYCGSPTLSWDWSNLCVGLLGSSQPPVSSRRETFLLSRLFTEDIFANAQLGHSSLSAFSPCQINKDQQTGKPAVDYFNFIL